MPKARTCTNYSLDKYQNYPVHFKFSHLQFESAPIPANCGEHQSGSLLFLFRG
jgi:hypothetical protein